MPVGAATLTSEMSPNPAPPSAPVVVPGNIPSSIVLPDGRAPHHESVGAIARSTANLNHSITGTLSAVVVVLGWLVQWT